MKLRTLTINNIASIENARIDFDGTILGDTDLFLICGPTGSGKSTILDAICLALFNNTPRVEGSVKNEILDIEEDRKDKDAIKFKDPKNLVRKNAVNAKVVLSFQGADGHEYTAKWEMTRIGQFKNGKEVSTFVKEDPEKQLQRSMKIERSIIDETDGITYSGATDLKQCVETKAVKMEFAQFCKTTMLAQGEFTKFLSSSADEKANILEKLADAGIYSKVGGVINRTYNEMAAEVKTQQKLLENYKFLSPEEIAQRNESKAKLDEEIKKIGEKSSAIDKKINYLADKQRIAKEIENAKQKLAAAIEANNTEDAKSDQRTIALWDSTQDLRTAIAKKAELEKDAADLKEKETRYGRDYATGLNAIAWQERELAALAKKIGEAQQKIAEQEQYRKMYDNAGVISSTYDSIVDSNVTIADNAPKLEKYDTEIANLQKDKDAVENSRKQAMEKIAVLEKEQEAQNTVLRANKSDQLLADTEANSNMRADAEAVKTALSLYLEKKDAYGKKQKEVEADEQSVADKKALHENAQKTQGKAEVAYKKSKELYDKMHESISYHAQALRIQLQVGDNCPVCGNRVEVILDENSLKETLKPLEENYKADEKNWEDAKDAKTNAKAAYDQALKTLQKSTREADDAKTKLEEKHQDLEKKCLKAKIEISGDIAEQLNALFEKVAAEAANLRERQAAVTIANNIIKEITKEIKKIREEKIQAADDKIKELAEDIQKHQTQKAEAQGKIANAKKVIATSQQKLDEMINKQWQAPDGSDFYQALKQAAVDFKNLEQQLADNLQSQKTMGNDLHKMQSCQRAVVSLMPKWIDVNAQNPAALDNAVTHWTNLQANCANLNTQIHDNAQSLKVNSDFIADFESQHPDVDIAEIAMMAKKSEADIQDIRNRVDTLRNTVSNAQALLDNAQRQQAELQEVVIEDNEDKESLEQAKLALAEKSDEASQQIGSIKHELEADEQARREWGESKKKLDELSSECEQWRYLDSYLGGPNGKKFKNIAQSYILSDLLDKANAYMANISDRYTLFCNPGTLTIMLRDSEQGGSVRPTNTLSGGESFIVSLSLALGLSSMQSVGFEVDTLFIDEGFGTLSAEYLDPVIKALQRLHQVYKRRVGIISHVDSLKTRIPVCIEVSKKGTQPSDVEVKVN